MSSPISFAGETAVVTFDRFELDDYRLFLDTKQLPESQVAYDVDRDHYTVTTPSRFAVLLGVTGPISQIDRLAIADHLFDYQRWALAMALDAKRFALWLDTGLGKTIVYWEWVRQVRHLTNGRVLVFAPLGIIEQAIEMAAVCYGDALPIERLDTRDDLIAWCTRPDAGIAITNQQKLIAGKIPELRHCAGIVIDESSWLKSGGGVTKWNAIHSCTGIEYKLSCTATPAPNDAMEYASQAAWLETIRHEGEVLWTFFQSDRKTGEWTIKPHAQAAFYRFLASWSLYMRDPKAFGFADILSNLPDPIIEERPIPMTAAQRERSMSLLVNSGKGMFADRLGVQERAKLCQIARGFLYLEQGKDRKIARIPTEKPAEVTAWINGELAADRQVLVWTSFDEEAQVLLDEFGEGDVPIGVLTGSMSEAQRVEVMRRFRAGELRVLISKPQLIGYGLNLQFVRSMVFNGFDDSFERIYQAIRRCYRLGQTEPVRVFVPYVAELEGMVFENLQEKERRFLADVAIQEAHYRDALAELAPVVGQAAA